MTGPRSSDESSPSTRDRGHAGDPARRRKLDAPELPTGQVMLECRRPRRASSRHPTQLETETTMPQQILDLTAVRRGKAVIPLPTRVVPVASLWCLTLLRDPACPMLLSVAQAGSGGRLRSGWLRRPAPGFPKLFVELARSLENPRRVSVGQRAEAPGSGWCGRGALRGRRPRLPHDISRKLASRARRDRPTAPPREPQKWQRGMRHSIEHAFA
jgi:hypothetical protein